MDITTLATLIATAVSAAATLVLAILTAKYVRLTSVLAEEAITAKDPIVYVDIELDTFGLKLVIGNVGTTSAQNITFSIQDSIQWNVRGESPTGINSLSIVKNGLAYLPPKRILKFYAGDVKDAKGAFPPGSKMHVLLNFENEAGRKIIRRFTIDLASYSEVLYESFTNPAKEVARAIRDTDFGHSSKDRMKGIVELMTKKSCSICGSSIPHKARKCPKCLEYLPEQPDRPREA